MIMSMFPEIMVAHVATQTQRIRVGTGGVMLPNHSAFSVAERFAMLEALYPGRIDLGIGRAPGTDGRTALALRRSWEAIKQDTFPEQLTELLGFLGHNLPDKHPFAHINASPDPFLIPEIYMLGSSTGGVEFALTKGLPFVFAAQINADLRSLCLPCIAGSLSLRNIFRNLKVFFRLWFLQQKPMKKLIIRQRPLFYTGRC